MVRWIVILLLILLGASIYVARQRSAASQSAASQSTASQGAGEQYGASSSGSTEAAAAPQLLASGCTPPASIANSDGTVQSDTPSAMTPFEHADAVLKPLAGFSVDARVLSTKTYRSDREAKYAPIDLALGWGPMRDDAVLEKLDISQSGRWYNYRWSDQPPIAPDDIVRSSANMHMIPSNPAVADALDDLDADDRIRIDGWLVHVQARDGWRWRSSLSREDSGDGACEVIYVCAVSKR